MSREAEVLVGAAWRFLLATLSALCLFEKAPLSAQASGSDWDDLPLLIRKAETEMDYCAEAGRLTHFGPEWTLASNYWDRGYQAYQDGRSYEPQVDSMLAVLRGVGCGDDFGDDRINLLRATEFSPCRLSNVLGLVEPGRVSPPTPLGQRRVVGRVSGVPDGTQVWLWAFSAFHDDVLDGQLTYVQAGGFEVYFDTSERIWYVRCLPEAP